jgi:Arc/MetJ-type ribon-helix-helix transcriptional regulator
METIGGSHYNTPGGRAVTMTITLKHEAARLVERHIAEGRYPDAESAIAAALVLLEESSISWADVDAAAMRKMIQDADAEGGKVPFDEVMANLDTVIESARRR